MFSDYEKAEKILTSKDKFHIELGLGRIKEILCRFDNPQEKLKIIHVAGTNGKGSTCSILSCILQAAGLRVGLFTSPHLVKYTERIKINGEAISDSDFLKILTEVTSMAQTHSIHLTEFEILTAAAFIYFERQNIDFAIMEVGLGGRLDATNVVTKPILSAITSISKDHTDRLGNTIEQIAAEKAGIIKNGVTCVVLENNAGLQTIKNIAESNNAPLIIAKNTAKIKVENNKNFALIDGKKYEFLLFGEYQAENLSLCLTILNILQQKGLHINGKSIERGLKNVRHSARFEYNKDLNLVIDGAHNPDGARALRQSLNIFFTKAPVTFIYATINTKDYASILKTLIRPCDELIFYRFKRENAVEIGDLEEIAPPHSGKIGIANNAQEILKIAKKNLENRHPVVLTGSLYAIGEIYAQIISTSKI